MIYLITIIFIKNFVLDTLFNCQNDFCIRLNRGALSIKAQKIADEEINWKLCLLNCSIKKIICRISAGSN